MHMNVRQVSALLTSAALLLTVATGCKKEETEDNGGFRVGYQSGLTVVEDPDALQKAVDEMYAQKDVGIALEYKNEAYSTDGTNFNCYIANSADNAFDMFLTIYGDDAYTDELFLSGLVPPGSAFDHLTLNHSLDKGSHTVYVAFTQVEDVDGEQSIHNQMIHTMEFIVQ